MKAGGLVLLFLTWMMMFALILEVLKGASFFLEAAFSLHCLIVGFPPYSQALADNKTGRISHSRRPIDPSPSNKNQNSFDFQMWL